MKEAGRYTRNTLKKQITIYAQTELMEKLESSAHEMGMTVNDLITFILWECFG